MSRVVNRAQTLSLIADYREDEMVAFDTERSISQQQFLQQVIALSKVLPDKPYGINLCRDRYYFLLVFSAQIVRGTVNILPANDKTATVENVSDDFNDVYCIGDSESDVPHLSVIDLLATLSPSPCELPSIRLDQVVAIAYTSGSTGKPQPNVKTWGMLSGTAQLLGERLSANGVTLVATVPAQHMYGLETSVMMTLCCSCQLYLGETFYPQDIHNAFAWLADKPGMAVLITTPVHLQALHKSELRVAGIHKVISATAPLFPALTHAIESQHDTVIEEIYGFTEAGSVATRRTAESDEWLLLDGMELYRNDAGIQVRGMQLSENKSVHDVIEILKQGRAFRLQGRGGELLNVAGKRIALAELNQKLLAVAGVDDAVVVMPESQSTKQRPSALVVLQDGVTKRDVQNALAKQVDGVFVPRPMMAVNAIPRNATGKPQRQALLELLEHHEKNI